MSDEKKDRTPEEIQEIIDKQLADVPEKIRQEQTLCFKLYQYISLSRELVSFP